MSAIALPAFILKLCKKMKQYFVYILLCSDNSYYTGITNNLERRLYEHETGLDPNSYTCKRRPVKMVLHEMFNDVNHAIALRNKLKAGTEKRKKRS